MNTITLIAGMLSNGRICYWRCDFEVNINDIVVVNNREGYDAVKVVGIVTTAEENVKHFTAGAKLKDGVRVIVVPGEEVSV